MEKLLSQNIVTQVREIFQQLQHPVEMLLFVSQAQAEACDITRQLLEEVVALSGLLSLRVHDLISEPELAQLFQVTDKAPAIIIAASEAGKITDYGIRLLGVPSGHEFSTLIQDVILVAGRDSGLSSQTRKFIQGLEKPLHLQVFVTPT
jgi:alkyl hydroperoxide reductase subunit AhpF